MSEKYNVTIHDDKGSTTVEVEDKSEEALFFQDLIDKASQADLPIEYSSVSGNSITVEKSSAK
jgi:hypothetical protein